MKNDEYEEWLEYNNLTAEYTEQELEDLYKIFNKNNDFKNEDLPF